MAATRVAPVFASDFPTLKAKQRQIRGGFPEPFGLRIHRAISWLGRAEAAGDDQDLRFILLWIGFNAAYAVDLNSDVHSERGSFRTFFDALVGLDPDRRIYNAVWTRFPHEIRLLLENRYVFQPFWNFHNGVARYEDWEARLAASRRKVAMCMAQQDTPALLTVMFDRLYVLRNQLVHGGSTWNSSANRTQVTDGARVLGWLLPVFIDIMMDNPHHDWGRPFYPLVTAA